jgi:hypothetical protein
MRPGFYAFAIGRAGHPVPEDVEAVSDGALAAFVMPVDLDEYSQDVIDAKGRDVEWLGQIGYRHQDTMMKLLRGGTIVPLRAFTLFANEESVRQRLRNDAAVLITLLDRLEGKQEWTLRIEIEPERWSEALTRRAGLFRSLLDEIESATPGKAFLLRKKLDEEKKRASREAEGALVSAIEKAILEHLACDTLAESRQQRDGAFPQINALINRDEEARLQELVEELTPRYAGEGVSLAVSGPWPPYSFVNMGRNE